MTENYNEKVGLHIDLRINLCSLIVISKCIGCRIHGSGMVFKVKMISTRVTSVANITDDISYRNWIIYCEVGCRNHMHIYCHPI